jgi:hypothetical protein
MYVYYHARTVAIEHKMEQTLETAQLTTITINSNNIVWAKKNKEIIYNNQLFDVKKILIKNNIATITGLYDTAEKKVKEKAEALVKDQKKNSNTVAQNYFQLQWFVEHSTADEQLFSTAYNKLPTPLYLIFYCNAFIEVQTPPPNYMA